MNNPCVLCHYARMRKDICGIYCVGDFFKKEDGTCDHYLYYRKKKRKEEHTEAGTGCCRVGGDI